MFLLLKIVEIIETSMICKSSVIYSICIFYVFIFHLKFFKLGSGVFTLGESATIFIADWIMEEGMSLCGWTETHSLNSVSIALDSCIIESNEANKRGALWALCNSTQRPWIKKKKLLLLLCAHQYKKGSIWLLLSQSLGRRMCYSKLNNDCTYNTNRNKI